MNGTLRRLALPAAVVAASMTVGAALLLGRASGAVSAPAAGPRTGVVVVHTKLAFVGSGASGTGIVVSASGLVLTNNHVIRGASTVRVTDPSDGLTFPASVLGYSVAKDVALLQLKNPRRLAPARLGNSSTARIGQLVRAVGNAGGTGSLTVVNGRVTGLKQAITVNDGEGNESRLVGLIETSAPLEPGDSGGPLLANGRVIGVDAAASGTTGFNDAPDGFAIPINVAVSVARQIESGRRSSTVHVGPTAFLGVLLEQPDYPGGAEGAIVSRVFSGSAAERAGIQDGDVITAAGGRTIVSAAGLRRVMFQAVPGKPLRLSWTDSQQGNTRTVVVRPAAGPPQ
jgi:S1-C subfamily serine protease